MAAYIVIECDYCGRRAPPLTPQAELESTLAPMAVYVDTNDLPVGWRVDHDRSNWTPIILCPQHRSQER